MTGYITKDDPDEDGDTVSLRIPNKENGLGRPDILLKDRKNRRAIIVESKKSKKKADLNKDCDKALKQIVDEMYAEGLNGYEQIICYGVAFFQKQAKVKRLTME